MSVPGSDGDRLSPVVSALRVTRGLEMAKTERKKRKDATDHTKKVLVFVDDATKKAVKRAARKEDVSEREWWRRAAAERLERMC